MFSKRFQLISWEFPRYKQHFQWDIGRQCLLQFDCFVQCERRKTMHLVVQATPAYIQYSRQLLDLETANTNISVQLRKNNIFVEHAAPFVYRTNVRIFSGALYTHFKRAVNGIFEISLLTSEGITGCFDYTIQNDTLISL